MKKLFIFFFSIFLFSQAYAQTKNDAGLNESDMNELNIKPMLKGPDLPPQFPGGITEFRKFISKNISYPDSIQRQGIYGIVVVRFIIEKDGHVSSATIKKSVSPDLDKEALRVIGISPNWTPAIQNGRNVRVSISIPIHFFGSADQDNSKIDSSDVDISEVYNKVDVKPEFPGGREGLLNYVKKNENLPATLTENAGIATVSFIVEKDGTLTQVKIFSASTAAMAAEAVRLMRASPKWTPAISDNKPVRAFASVTIPFNQDTR